MDVEEDSTTMRASHPFDSVLTTIDPATRRVALDDLAALTGDQPLNVTVLHVGVGTVAAIDLNLRRGPQERLVMTTPLGYTGPTVAFSGVGVSPEDGTVAPFVLGIEPCLCPWDAGDDENWNPLALAVMWHPEIPHTVGMIARMFVRNVAANQGRYCQGGLDLLAAMINGQRTGQVGPAAR
jgi:hypothetical protein